DYVREQFNRADALEEGRKGTVGFALTILQRRLASSPEAIFQSLRRRRERLEKRLTEQELLSRGAQVPLDRTKDPAPMTEEDIEDLDEAPDGELEEKEEQILDQATAARTIAELRAEIEILKGLEEQARKLRNSQTDRKWDELRTLLLNEGEMF